MSVRPRTSFSAMRKRGIWHIRPPFDVRVDMGHSLARDLVGWWMTTPGSKIQNLATPFGGAAARHQMNLTDDTARIIDARFGEAFVLNGTDEFAAIPDDAALRPQNMTVLQWTSHDGADNSGQLSTHDVAADTGWNLTMHPDVNASFFPIFVMGNAGVWPTYAALGSQILSNGLHCVVGVHSNSIHKVYADGQEVGSDTSGAVTHNSGQDLWLGRSANAPSVFQTGDHHITAFWSRALLNYEIEWLFNEPFAILESVALKKARVRRDLQTFNFANRGRHRVINNWAGSLRGLTKTAIDTFDFALKGRHRVINNYFKALRGSHQAKSGFEISLKGSHAVSTLAGISFIISLRGVHGIQQTYDQSLKARNRIANDPLAQFELFIRADAEPDLAGTPTETFAALPHDTAALTPPAAGERKYFLVLRERNAYDLTSENIQSWTVIVDSTGAEVFVLPSAPNEYDVEPAAAINVTVTAQYLYLVDGDNQADTWAIFLTSDGSSPVPTGAPFTTIAMVKVDGVAKLDTVLGPFNEGDLIRVIVATRRGSVQSSNIDIVETTATGTGPTQPEADIHIGDQASISSTEGDNN